MQSFVLSLSIIGASLFSGYVFNICIARGLVPLSKEQSEQLRLGMQKTVLLAVNPVAFCGAVWIADLSVGRYFALPFICLVGLAAGLGLGFAGSWLSVYHWHAPAVQGRQGTFQGCTYADSLQDYGCSLNYSWFCPVAWTGARPWQPGSQAGINSGGHAHRFPQPCAPCTLPA